MERNEIKVYFNPENRVVIEKNPKELIEFSQIEGKLVLLQLYDMFTDPNAKKFFPDLEATTKL